MRGNRICYYCLEKYDANVACADGYFVCDKCHSLPANNFIERTCIKSKLEDPLELVSILMKNPKIKMHELEHHFLVPAKIMSVYYNKMKGFRKKENKSKNQGIELKKYSGGFVVLIKYVAPLLVRVFLSI